MAKFKEAVLTRKGIALLAKAQAEHKSITFTGAVTGNGDYEDGEDISSRTSLKSEQQTFAPTLIRRQNETNVYVHFTITNYQEGDALEHGYYVTEIGLIANDPDEGEILYGIAIGEPGKCDYLPAYDSLLPAVIGVDFLIEVGNADQVNIVTDLSAYATHEEVEELKTLVDELSLEIHEVNLTNSNDFYFNNSAKTVALSAMRSTTDYRVDTEIQGNTINVGDIVVYDKQMNGFKIAYTGSAASVTVKCYISGGAA